MLMLFNHSKFCYVVHNLSIILLKLFSLLVISDGVGGWNNHNIDPSLFSKELCKNIIDLFMQYELTIQLKDSKSVTENCDLACDYVETYSTLIAKKLLYKSVLNTQSLGTSTCTILMLDKVKGKLYTVLCGDSCYMLLQINNQDRYEIKYKASEQIHSFNTPFQVGVNGDNPESAIINEHDMKTGDLVILATDG